MHTPERLRCEVCDMPTLGDTLCNEHYDEQERTKTMHTPTHTAKVSQGIGKLQGTIVRSGDILKIGKDVVDAVVGKLQAQGKVGVEGNSRELTWVSTMDCTRSESILRKAVKDEGKRITYFQSQGV